MDAFANPVPVQLELNLQKICVNVVAIQLWERYKKQIRQVFEKSSFFILKNFDSITEQVLKQLDDISLPGAVLVDLRHTICFIGEKIIRWTNQVKNEFGLEVKYAKNIAWTWYGTIDKGKTFQLYWQNDSKLLAYDIRDNKLNERSNFVHSIYSIACVFVQEAFISENLNLMKGIIKNFSRMGFEISDEHSLISMWLCYYIRNIKEEACSLYLECNLDIILFSLCASAGYLNAVKYFSTRLEPEDDKVFYLNAKKTLEKFIEKKSQSLNKRDDYVETLIFLINGMSLERQILFLRQSLPSLYDVLIDTWPWKELFLQILNHTLPFMTEGDKEKLLASVLTYFYNQENYQDKTDKTIPRRVLQKMLKLTSKEVKKKKLLDWRHFFYKLIYLSDYPTLKIILNDPDVTTYRHDVIKIGVDEVLKLCALSGELDPLADFIKQILTDQDKLIFKDDFRIIKSLLTDGNYELCEKLLNWMSDSAEEKIKLKGQIDSADVLLSLYEINKFSLPTAEKLLNWQFDQDEDRKKQVKNILKEEYFIRPEIYKIWGANCTFSLESSKTKCSEFLNFFFEPYEIESFKREKIIEDEDFIKIFCDHLRLPGNFDTVDEFLKFCSLSQEKIDEIKEKLLENIEHWVQFFVTGKNNFRIAEALINWVVEDEENKTALVSRYIKPAENAELYREMLNKSNKYSVRF